MSQCPSGHFVLFYVFLFGHYVIGKVGSQCPSGHFVLFYGWTEATIHQAVKFLSQCPSGHFVLFYKETERERKKSFGVSMPFRAFCSFLPTNGNTGGESDPKCLNALPGILFFSTLLLWA